MKTVTFQGGHGSPLAGKPVHVNPEAVGIVFEGQGSKHDRPITAIHCGGFPMLVAGSVEDVLAALNRPDVGFLNLFGPDKRIADARKVLNMPNNGMDMDERNAFGSMAAELTRRFDYKVDVLDMTFGVVPHDAWVAAVSDLFSIATSPMPATVSTVAEMIGFNMRRAALTFYYLMTMRAIEVTGSKASRGPAGDMADKITGALRAAFP